MVGYIVGVGKSRVTSEVAASGSAKLGAEMVLAVGPKLDVDVEVDGDHIVK